MTKLCKKRSHNHAHNVDDAYNPNSDYDVQQTKREWPDRKERKIDYIRYAATIDNICISVLVTEMIIEFITVFIKSVNKTKQKNLKLCTIVFEI
jgi:hypothetical protein